MRHLSLTQSAEAVGCWWCSGGRRLTVVVAPAEHVVCGVDCADVSEISSQSFDACAPAVGDLQIIICERGRASGAGQQCESACVCWPVSSNLMHSPKDRCWWRRHTTGSRLTFYRAPALQLVRGVDGARVTIPSRHFLDACAPARGDVCLPVCAWASAGRAGQAT